MSFKKIMVALNQDTESRSPIFERAIELADRHKARLMLFHCIPQDTVAGFEDRVGATMSELEQSKALAAFDKRHRVKIEHMQAWLDGLCRVCREKGLRIESAVEVGRPGQAIIDLARNWSADLIVIGLTKRSAITDWLTSSVTSRVVHQSPCSVILIHD
jgi:nucleotide-binding universal stress UspA family protein